MFHKSWGWIFRRVFYDAFVVEKKFSPVHVVFLQLFNSNEYFVIWLRFNKWCITEIKVIKFLLWFSSQISFCPLHSFQFCEKKSQSLLPLLNLHPFLVWACTRQADFLPTLNSPHPLQHTFFLRYMSILRWIPSSKNETISALNLTRNTNTFWSSFKLIWIFDKKYNDSITFSTCYSSKLLQYRLG